MKIAQVLDTLNQWAPPSYQESYDNATLIVGDRNKELTQALVTLDCTEDIVDEAIATNANLVIAHHPIVFKGLKSLTGKNYIERTVIKAIKNDIAIFAIHTNLDNIQTGVNSKICQLIGLESTRILVPKKETLSKLVTFVPTEHLNTVQNKLFEAGAGQIGNYDQCSFYQEGTGTFRPNENANPFIGRTGETQYENEVRIEVLLPSHKQDKVLNALKKAHPYEEVAYYLNTLTNENQEIGAGMVGYLPEEMEIEQFMQILKDRFDLQVIRHTRFHKKLVRKIAVCGGSGSFLLGAAKGSGADVFITGDFKYHEFFDAENQIIIADIGHYESEVFTKELICDFLREKIPNIAVNLSKVSTNPTKFF